MIIEFRSKHPHTTVWLRIDWAEEAKPEKLLADLAANGWVTDAPGFLQPLNWPCADLGKPGTGPFNSQTPGERKLFVSQARYVLRRHGIKGVKHRKLTLADML